MFWIDLFHHIVDVTFTESLSESLFIWQHCTLVNKVEVALDLLWCCSG